MLEQLLNYPVDTTGYLTIPRGVTLLGGLVMMSFVPARIDNRLFLVGGTALAVYGIWRMLGYSPAMDWWPVAVAARSRARLRRVDAGARQGGIQHA